MLAVPALISYKIYHYMVNRKVIFKGALVGGLSVALTVVILVVLLILTDLRFTEGTFSVINILVLGHLPLVAIEALVTGSALNLIAKAKPDMLEQKEAALEGSQT